MVRFAFLIVLGLLTICLVGIPTAFPAGVKDSSEVLLRENWFIQSSADVHADGAAISTVGFPRAVGIPRPCPLRS